MLKPPIPRSAPPLPDPLEIEMSPEFCSIYFDAPNNKLMAMDMIPATTVLIPYTRMFRREIRPRKAPNANKVTKAKPYCGEVGEIHRGEGLGDEEGDQHDDRCQERAIFRQPTPRLQLRPGMPLLHECSQGC